MLEVTSSSSLVYPSPDAAQIILLVSAEELLLSGLESETKVTSSCCLPGNRCLGQQQAEWLFGIGSQSSHLRCFSHSWFYFETKIPITFLTLHPQTVVLSAFWAAVVREYPSWKEKRNLMRRSNSSLHLAFEWSGFRFGEHNMLLLLGFPNPFSEPVNITHRGWIQIEVSLSHLLCWHLKSSMNFDIPCS